MAERFAQACGLSADAAAYFQELGAFAHARSGGDQNEGYARLRGHRRYRSAQRLDVQDSECCDCAPGGTVEVALDASP
jgi:hypothetical protein